MMLAFVIAVHGRHRREARLDVVAARLGLRGLGDRRRDLPLPGRRRHLRGVHAARHGVAAGLRAGRARRRCDRPTRLDTRRLRGGMLVVPAAFTLLALAPARHRPLLAPQPRWRSGSPSAPIAGRRRALRADLPREPAHARRERARRGHRLADRARQPARADARPRRARRRGLAERPVAARAVRPRRLQDLQRHLRPPGRRRAAGAAGREPRRTRSATRGSAYRMGGDEFCLLATRRRLRRCSSAPRHALQRVRRALRDPLLLRLGDARRVAQDPVDALRIADQRMYANKRRGRRSSDEAVHQVLLRVAAEHDGELRDHVDDVADLVERGRRASSGSTTRSCSRSAAPPPLHDIGKVAIPDAILHAPRALTRDEWEYMRQHTIIGERIIRAAPELRRRRRASCAPATSAGTAAATRTASPGEEIPLGARIVAVCDTYDAIVTDRAYRKAAVPEEALAELARCAGTPVRPGGRRRLRARARARGRSLRVSAPLRLRHARSRCGSPPFGPDRRLHPNPTRSRHEGVQRCALASAEVDCGTPTNAPARPRDAGRGRPGPMRSTTHDLRVSDADREAAARALRNHCAEGRLTVGELDERSGTILTAFGHAPRAVRKAFARLRG